MVDSLLKILKLHFTFLACLQGFPEMANFPLTDIEVVHTINSINNKNSAGYDEMLNKILVMCPIS